MSLNPVSGSELGHHGHDGSDPFDQLPDGVVFVDGNQRITYANRAALRLTGYSAKELVDERCGAFLNIRDDKGERFDVSGRAPAGFSSMGGPGELEAVIRRGDGSDLRVRLTSSDLRVGDGEVSGAVISVRAAARPDPATTSGIDLLSAVNHELRSPLTSVKGYTNLLLNRWDTLPDQQKQAMLRQVNHDADRITRLMGELLDVSRLEARRLPLHREIVDLAHLSRAVVDRVRFGYPELTADVCFPDGFPAVYVDPDRIEQVLTNLVENACKYASPVSVLIEGSAAGGQASVSVIDQGDGIPEHELPRVFDPFFRRAHSRPAGSGLGLWISRGLVESHGGRLSAESKVGHGSKFTFTLPFLDLGRLQGT